ncbi:MAG: PASTA domain-containing protein [Rikenellaceae bacterium]
MKKSKKKGSASLYVGLNIVAIIVAIAALLTVSHLSLRWMTRSQQRVEVPDFRGLSLSEAKSLAEKSDLNLCINDSLYVNSVAKGAVLDQQPSSGVEVKPDRTIYIVINAFGDRLVNMPYVADYSLRQAINTLEAASLTIDRLEYQQDIATNYILSQKYLGRSVNKESQMMAKAGGAVTLVVGVDRAKYQYTTMPMVEGLSLARAKVTLWGAGVNVGSVNFSPGFNLEDEARAVVIKQSINPEERASWGSSVNLTLGYPSERVIREVVLKE